MKLQIRAPRTTMDHVHLDGRTGRSASLFMQPKSMNPGKFKTLDRHRVFPESALGDGPKKWQTFLFRVPYFPSYWPLL